MELLEFYPTPKALLDTVLNGLDYRHIKTVLEPSAGKGDIVEYIAKKMSYFNRTPDIDCIEKNKELANILKGKNMRVVHDDFLTYRTEKRYDLIVMNPPFSEADLHLTKAIQLQREHGGAIICIMNAETIRNPYSNVRKALNKELEESNADIEFIKNAFSDSERPTDVEIAVIKVRYEEKQTDSIIMNELKTKHYAEQNTFFQNTELAQNDFIDAIVTSYQIEAEAGTKLIQEYKALLPRLSDSVKKDKYSSPLIELKTGSCKASVNEFIENLRMKYWRALFSDKRITGRMTGNMVDNYMSKVNELRHYEFSAYNIKTLQLDMQNHLIRGIEDCIIELFDKLTYKYHWDEKANNVHYFNGWKTNEAWIVNKKVILPFYSFERYGSHNIDVWDATKMFSDMEKALNYLDTGNTMPGLDIYGVLEQARNAGNTKNIPMKYFNVTIYKKGTCHITFKDEDLLKKFNIFGAQHKGWLPPSYGKKTYNEMNDEEKNFIDSFEGKKSYNDVIDNPQKYLLDTSMFLRLEKCA